MRQRLNRSEKAAGGADIEYLRNVLLRWFALPPEERGALFPVIAAACSFSAAEIASLNQARRLPISPPISLPAPSMAFADLLVASLNQARERQAAASSSWLSWGAASGVRHGAAHAYADGPPGTPLQAPPPSCASRAPHSARGPPPSAQLARTASCTLAATPAAGEGSSGAAGGAGDAAGGADAEQVAALHDRIAKLRWLLQCANGEIKKLREAKPERAEAATSIARRLAAEYNASGGLAQGGRE